MLNKAMVETPNTNKGEGRCRGFNILPNIFATLNNDEKFDYISLILSPKGLIYFPMNSVFEIKFVSHFSFLFSKTFTQSSTSCAVSLRSLAVLEAESRTRFTMRANVSEERTSALAARASNCTR